MLLEVQIKMSQDTVADALNMIRNSQKAGKKTVKVKIISTLLIRILKIMREKDAINFCCSAKLVKNKDCSRISAAASFSLLASTVPLIILLLLSRAVYT